MKNITLYFCLTFFFQMVSFNISAQDDIIKLKNPSFEDIPRAGIQPRGWYDCGRVNFPLETPPDVHPAINNPYGVNLKAQDGATYLGMVVRENDSWEAVAQRLPQMLKADSCYYFSIQMAKSETYESAIRGGNPDEKVNFITPVLLKIWGGVGYCQSEELLAVSELVANTSWEKFEFLFKPKYDLEYIIFEAFYPLESKYSEIPNGHILLDNASWIIQVDCNEELDVISDSLSLIVSNDQLNGDLFEIPKVSEETTVENNLHRLLMNAGYPVKFKKNKLTENSVKNIQTMAAVMGKLDNQILVIDFNGMKEKKFLLRLAAVRQILLAEELSETKFIIRNTEEEDDRVNWLVDKDDFFVGILKNK